MRSCGVMDRSFIHTLFSLAGLLTLSVVVSKHVCLHACMPGCMHACQHAIYPSVCLYVCPSVRPSVCLPVCTCLCIVYVGMITHARMHAHRSVLFATHATLCATVYVTCVMPAICVVYVVRNACNACSDHKYGSCMEYVTCMRCMGCM